MLAASEMIKELKGSFDELSEELGISEETSEPGAASNSEESVS